MSETSTKNCFKQRHILYRQSQLVLTLRLWHIPDQHNIIPFFSAVTLQAADEWSFLPKALKSQIHFVLISTVLDFKMKMKNLPWSKCSF